MVPEGTQEGHSNIGNRVGVFEKQFAETCGNSNQGGLVCHLKFISERECTVLSRGLSLSDFCFWRFALAAVLKGDGRLRRQQRKEPGEPFKMLLRYYHIWNKMLISTFWVNKCTAFCFWYLRDQFLVGQEMERNFEHMRFACALADVSPIFFTAGLCDLVSSCILHFITVLNLIDYGIIIILLLLLLLY